MNNVTEKKLAFVQIGFLLGKGFPTTTIPCSQSEVEDSLQQLFNIHTSPSDRPEDIVLKMLTLMPPAVPATAAKQTSTTDPTDTAYDHAMKGI